MKKGSGNCRKIDSIISVRSITKYVKPAFCQNVAVIDKLDINLHDGVSVLTGGNQCRQVDYNRFDKYDFGRQSK